MRCIHAKLNYDKTDYISSLEKIKSDDDSLRFKCKSCGMEFTEEDFITIATIWDPSYLIKYNYEFILSGPLSPFAPSRKDVKKNLESVGLLGPEIEVDD